jgi:predicted membrane chloride channel (bestrophin family)
MNIYLEILLRALGVFLGVFFTVGWGRKSKPEFDVFLIIFAVVMGIFLAFRQPGAATAVATPIMI